MIKVVPIERAKKNICIKNHLIAQDLNEAVQQSKIVISRAGYTTIMDLIKLQKKGIIVPTPGQTEQEYLSAYLQQQNLFIGLVQDRFSLKEAIEKAADFNFSTINFNMELYKDITQLPSQYFFFRKL